MDVDNGFFMVKFDLEADREKVIEGGPWMIFDHYLAVSNWSPNFVSTTAKVAKTLVWIRFPGMNLDFYDESLLLAMASTVGRPVKVDEHTLKVQRGRFARVCMEIDLNEPVVGKIFVKGRWYNIEYEGLHVICGKCGCYGHVTRNCTQVVPPVVIEDIRKHSPAAAAVDANESTQQATNQPSNPKPITDVINANDSITNDVPTDVPTIKEPIHGDLLVVTRRKKGNQVAPKLKEKNKQIGPQSQSTRFDTLHNNNHDIGNGPIVKPMLFSAGPSGTKEVDPKKTPFNPKHWAKKRPR